MDFEGWRTFSVVWRRFNSRRRLRRLEGRVGGD